MAAFYEPDGDRLVATGLTRGPWDERVQHGGPPAALLARAATGAPSDVPRQLARITVELLRPIPIGPVHILVEPPTGGRLVDRVVTRLLVDDRELARATALRVRAADVAIDAARTPDVAPLSPAPDQAPPWHFTFFRWPEGFHTAVELRAVRGTWGQGPMAAWLRPRVPLVAGEATDPSCAAVLIADAANGVRPILPIDRYTFLNADLTVAFARAPRGPWIGLDADATPGDAGAGLVRAALHDADGLCGQVLQSLVLAPR